MTALGHSEKLQPQKLMRKGLPPRPDTACPPRSYGERLEVTCMHHSKLRKPFPPHKKRQFRRLRQGSCSTRSTGTKSSSRPSRPSTPAFAVTTLTTVSAFACSHIPIWNANSGPIVKEMSQTGRFVVHPDRDVRDPAIRRRRSPATPDSAGPVAPLWLIHFCASAAKRCSLTRAMRSVAD